MPSYARADVFSERVKGIEPSYPAWEAGVLKAIYPRAIVLDAISVSLESVSLIPITGLLFLLL